MTAQGHPRAIFKRAIENGNLLAAETVMRELGRVTLAVSALAALGGPGDRAGALNALGHGRTGD